MDYPCSDKCVPYAMCKQKEPFVKFNQCYIYADFVKGGISKAQDDVDRERGKGKVFVVAIRPEDGGQLISKDGHLVDGPKIRTINED